MAALSTTFTPTQRARDVATLGLLEAGVGELDVMLADNARKREVLESKRSEALQMIAALREKLGIPEF
jgi:hypothetical protein